MGQKTYYHNITKGEYNINDYGDAVELSESTDVIKMSFRGNALMIDLTEFDSNLESEGEYDWARERFFDYFQEFHGKPFMKYRSYHE